MLILSTSSRRNIGLMTPAAVMRRTMRRSGMLKAPRAIVALALLVLSIPAEARSQARDGPAPEPSREATFIIGILQGGAFDGDLSFEGALLLGGRLGWSFISERDDVLWPGVGFEGSVSYSRGAVTSPSGPSLSTDAATLHGEASLLLILLRGPLQPFLAGGIGAQRVELDTGAGDLADTSFAWSWGGGLKATRGRLMLRGDVRQRISRLVTDSVPPIRDVDDTLRRWELSVGIGLTF